LGYFARNHGHRKIEGFKQNNQVVLFFKENHSWFYGDKEKLACTKSLMKMLIELRNSLFEKKKWNWTPNLFLGGTFEYDRFSQKILIYQ
jgi:hypothetical protein